MPRVVFTPSGLTADVEQGTSLLDAARGLGVDLDSVCGGRGICGRCQVTVEDGSFAKWAIDVGAQSLNVFTETEARYRDRKGMAPQRRLGCCALVQSDVVADVPPESQVHRPVVRKALALDDVVLDPAVSLAYVELAPSVLGDAASMSDLVIEQLFTDYQRHVDRLSPAALRQVHRAFAGQDRAATVAVRRSDDPVGLGEVVAVWPGFVERVGGIAVDIGSTTIAGHLCDLASGEVLASSGRMNPQIRFGEDLMSRVSYVMMNPGGDEQLTTSVRGALADLVTELAAEAGIGLDRVLEIVLVGNPIMHHLLLGIDPTPLGQAPFTLATAEAVQLPALELELPLPNARAYVGPCIAGHVGADTAAVVLAEGPHRSSTTQLVVDVGTNAEIVLGDSRQQFAASSPTGPAFEGAQLSCGQRATAGAIERVRIDRTTLEARVKVIGSDLWSDDPGFAESVEHLEISGICGSGIIEVVAEMYLAGVIDTDGVIQGSLAEQCSRVVPDGRTFRYVVFERGDVQLSITQNDVRAIQLAKAALRAGIDLLVAHAGLDTLDDIRLAGAFGASSRGRSPLGECDDAGEMR